MKISLCLLTLLSVNVLVSNASAQDTGFFNTCYSRVYSKAHLAANPKQKIDSITIEMHSMAEFPDALYAYVFVHDRKSKLQFEATGTGYRKQFNTTGTSRFGVDSDIDEGGEFSLTKAANGVLYLKVGSHLMLMDSTELEGEMNGPSDDAKTLTFEGADRDNNIFKLTTSQCK